MTDDERKLLEAYLQAPKHQLGASAFEPTCERLGIPVRRAGYILRKWTNRGWFEYGVTQRSGWLTAEGVEAGRTERELRDVLPAKKTDLAISAPAEAPAMTYASLRAEEDRPPRHRNPAEEDHVLDEGAADALGGLRAWARDVFKETGLVPYRNPEDGLVRYEMKQSLMVSANEQANGWRQAMSVENLLRDVETGELLAEPRDVLVIADFCDPSLLPSHKLLNPHTPFKPVDPAFRWCDECLGIQGSHDPGCPNAEKK